MALSCPNRNSQEWKSLVAKVGVNNAYLAFYENNLEIPNVNSVSDQISGVNTGLKILDALGSDKGLALYNRFFKNNKEKFYKELIPLAGKQQVDLLEVEVSLNNFTDYNDIITHIAKEMSYVTRIDITKELDTVIKYDEGEYFSLGEFEYEEALDGGRNIYFRKKSDGISTKITKEEYEEAKKRKSKEVKVINTQKYKDLTIVGGVNYIENEISTPAITPSIKGHAEFSTPNGIGWFRSDDKAFYKGDKNNSLTYEELEEKYGYIDVETPSDPIMELDGKTRRILEVQSDLFQKGRDKKDLIAEIDTINPDGVSSSVDKSTTKENQFLQLLNKNNNWVSFFIKSIIQDSKRKAYEKVLFPTGDTASKVEGHNTLEEFKKQKEKKINELEGFNNSLLNGSDSIVIEIMRKDWSYLGINRPFTEPNLETLQQFREANIKNNNEEIKQIKKELERLEIEGFGALKPVYNFYENIVSKILKKQGYNPVLITDEHGNTWNEVTLKEKDAEEFFFQTNSKYQEEANKTLEASIERFLNSIGVTVKQVKEITNRNGEVIEANAMADLLYKVIQVVDGKMKVDTLPEEASHFLVAMLRGSTLYNSMFNDIQNYEIYKDVVREYSEQYNGDTTKLKEEAIAKVIASILVGEFSDAKLEKRANSWWNRVITYLRELFGKTNKEDLYNTIQYSAPYSEAANLIINNNINQVYPHLENSPYSENEGEFYQLEEQTQKEVANAIEGNLGRGSLSLEGENYVLTKLDGTKKEIKRRVSNRVKELTKFFTERTPIEKQADAIRGAFGTKGHNDLENIFKRHIALEEGTIMPAKTEYLGESMYKVLEKYVSSYIKTFPKGTKFLIEQKIYDEKQDEAGTVDLIAIYPDGRVDITDWKFQEFKNKNKEIPNYKKNNWNVQLGRYAEMLSKVYGVKNIRNKRVIPIEAVYDNNVLKKIKVGSAEISEFGKSNSHLKPVPVSNEMTGDERVNKLIRDLLKQKETLMNTKPSSIADEAKRDVFIEQRKLKLAEIERVIQDIQLTNDIHSYVSRGIKELKDINDVGVENLTEEELQEAKRKTEFYGQRLISVLGDIVKDTSKEYKEDLKIVVANSQSLNGDISNELIKRTRDRHGDNITDAQKKGGFWERQMRTLSQQSHPVLKAFYELVNKSKDQTRNALEELKVNISKVTRELEEFQRGKGVDQRNLFDFMLNKTGKTLRLTAKYSPEYYKQADINREILNNGTKAEQDKALRWFEENTVFDEDRYNTNFETHKKETSKFYKNYDNPKEVIKKALSNYENKFGNNINGYKNKNNFYIRPKDEFFSQEYKYIQENAPLKDFYNLFTENTQLYRNIVGQPIDTRFVWNVEKDFVETIAENGIGSVADLRFIREAFKLKTGVRDGNIDTQTGKEIHSIPTYFLSGVETDQQSTDLGRVLFLAGTMTYNYKHMSEMETSAKSLEIILEQGEEILTDNNGEGIVNKLSGALERIITSSDTLDQFKDYMNYYVYGVKNKTKDYKVTIGGTEYSALAAYNFVNKMFIGKSLAGNPISIIANSVGGDWNARIIGAGKRFYSQRDYNSALKDLGTKDEKAYSIVGFLDIIDGENNWMKASDLSVHNLTKHLTYEKLFIGQKMGDYAIRNSVAIAMMKSHTVSEGKIVRKTESKKGDKSLYDLLEIKDNKLSNMNAITEAELSKFRNKILKVTEDILGNNSRDDIRLASLTIMGRALMAFRSWIPRTVDSRYGELRYSGDIEAYELGRYRSFWNQVVTKQFLPLIADILKDFGSFGLSSYGNATEERAKQLYREALAKNPDLKLTEQEYIDIHISNLRSNMSEARILGTMIMLLLMIKPAPDEDKDEISGVRKYVVRQMDRNLSELMFYYNVTEFNRILKSPIPITRAFTDLYSLFRDIGKEAFAEMTDDEKMAYDARPIKYALKIFPLLNGLENGYSIAVDEDYDREKNATFSSKSR